MSIMLQTDDGLDARFEMTTIAPRRTAVRIPLRTIVRSAVYGILVLIAFAIGTLAMMPGGSPLTDWLSPRTSLQPGAAGGCCSHLKLEIPAAATPVYEPENAPVGDRLAAESMR